MTALHHRTPAPQAESAGSQVLVLAERTDLARIRRRPLDVDAWWREGALSGDPSIIGPFDDRERAAA
jgi:hypothetical protein